MKNKTRNYSLDFIRALACIMIIVFHFSISSTKLYQEGSIFKNFSLGSLGVSLFIILSGASLSLSDKKYSYFDYIKKRIKSIYPLIYICTIYFGVINFLLFPHLFDDVPTYRLIYTIIGIDGILSYKFRTFNIVGEWYIGCIIFLYLIYPFLKKMIDKYPKTIFVSLLIIYILSIQFYGLNLSMDRNPIVRLFDFSLGIYFVKYFVIKPVNEKIKNITFICSFLIMILTLFISNNFNVMYNITLGGISTFIVLYYLADFVRHQSLKNIISIISKESYVIFLVHHQIQLLLASKFSADSFSYSRLLFIFLIYLILIVLTVNIINKIYDYIKVTFNKIRSSESY